MDKINPDTKSVSGQADDQHRGRPDKSHVAKTIFGKDLTDNDELKRPPEDRSPLTSLFNRR